MPRDLFGNVTRPSISIGSRKWYTLPVSLISHSAIVLLLIAIPILAPAVMPAVLADNDIEYMTTIIPPPPPPPARPPDIARPEPVANPDAAPTSAPVGINPERPDVIEPPALQLGTISGGDISAVELIPPPVAPKVPEPVRIGGTIRQPVKVRNVDPVYPAIAQAARVQGIVIIEATLSPDGRVSNARILRSIPLLDQAALEAVRQWEYTPTLLNGVPVPVIMTITVMFTLSK